MPITTLSSREFNQDTSRAKKAAEDGPVLLTVKEYQRLSGTSTSIIDMLSMPGVADIDFEDPRAQRFTKAADLDQVFLLDTNVVSELRKVKAGMAEIPRSLAGQKTPRL